MHPKLYVESSEQTIEDFKNIFSTYSKMLNFEKYKKVIDVGCGPGNITVELFYPYLNKSLEKLIGVDLSAKMIKYAEEHYSANPKINFQVLDITTNYLPQSLQCEFDLVTSFYCLQVISNISKLFQNMYAMLKPGGNLFLYFMGKCFAQDIWKNLSESSQWGPYMEDFQNKMCPVHRCKNPVQFVENMLTEVGFKVHFCTTQDYEKLYSKQLFFGLMKGINSFDVPKDLENDFILDHLNLFRSFNLVHVDEDGNEQFRYVYSLVIVHASKPL